MLDERLVSQWVHVLLLVLEQLLLGILEFLVLHFQNLVVVLDVLGGEACAGNSALLQANKDNTAAEKSNNWTGCERDGFLRGTQHTKNNGKLLREQEMVAASGRNERRRVHLCSA